MPFAFLLASCLVAPSLGAGPIVVTSPDGHLTATLALETDAAGRSSPTLKIDLAGRPVLLPSPLGVALADGPALGSQATIGEPRTREVRESYIQNPGKRRRVLDHFNEAVVPFREKNGRRWELVVRAYDDGVAFRYEFPAQDGWSDLRITGETTAFRFPEGTRAVATRMPGFASPHEERYLSGPIADLPQGKPYATPLLAEISGVGDAAILDANVADYAGMYLAREGAGASFVAKLSPRFDDPKLAVRAKLPHRSPWRVVMVGEGPGRLIESDLMLNLNDPCAVADVSWIKTGKTTFPWWNGFYEKPGVVPFKMGLNTETAKYYIDFCAEAGIPYHSLDGLDNIAWYGGTIVPYPGTDITRGIDGLDLREVLRYAESKGVKIRLWMHSAAAAKHMGKAFPLYRAWGVEGVMVDFFDRDDQETMAFTRRLVKTAADNRLTITLHNCHEPTGLERTYPNLLTSEAVMNLEWDKWDPIGIPPEHEVTVPYTRMLAGPMDFHQGSLRGVSVDRYKPRNAAPLVMGTPARMLASYVVYQNHLPMVADYPSAYRANPALSLLAAIPTNWDETRFLTGNVGESVAIARRHGDAWWIGVMTDRRAREFELPLRFLDKGPYQAEIHGDATTADSGLVTRGQDVGPGDILKLSLAPAGGALIRIRPLASIGP